MRNARNVNDDVSHPSIHIVCALCAREPSSFGNVRIYYIILGIYFYLTTTVLPALYDNMCTRFVGIGTHRTLSFQRRPLEKTIHRPRVYWSLLLYCMLLLLLLYMSNDKEEKFYVHTHTIKGVVAVYYVILREIQQTQTGCIFQTTMWYFSRGAGSTQKRTTKNVYYN